MTTTTVDAPVDVSVDASRPREHTRRGFAAVAVAMVLAAVAATGLVALSRIGDGDAARDARDARDGAPAEASALPSAALSSAVGFDRWTTVEVTAAEERAGIIARSTHAPSGAALSVRVIDGAPAPGVDLEMVAAATEKALAGSVERYEARSSGVVEIGGREVVRLDYGQTATDGATAMSFVMVVVPLDGRTAYVTVGGDAGRFDAAAVDDVVRRVVTALR